MTELMETSARLMEIDHVRESVRSVMQELIEAEAAGVIGAPKKERTDGRVTERNGYGDRLLAPRAGDVEPRIPKLSQGAASIGLVFPQRQGPSPPSRNRR